MTDDSQHIAPWLKPVEKYLEVWRFFDEDGTPPGATSDEIATLRIEAERQGLHIDDHVVEFLIFVNGTSFDSCNFGGTAIPQNDVCCRIDLLAYNRPDIKAAFGDITIYGTRDGVVFRYDEGLRQFQSMDGPDILATFRNFGEMIQSVFEDEISNLSDSARDRLRAEGVVL